MKTVLASVSDKIGLVDFLRDLARFEPVEIIATGSTAQHIQQAGLECRTVESLTGFPEILEGRVKTLHPKVFGAILAKDTPGHQEECRVNSIPKVDYVIVDLYPFEKTAKTPGKSQADVIENIDIGGVALIRAAAKNFERVTVLPGPAFYKEVIQELESWQGQLSPAFRQTMARRAFELTARYDSLIAAYFLGQEEDELPPRQMSLGMELLQPLRYGENPQQKALWYRQLDMDFEMPFTQLQGKEMSANNIVDAASAFNLIREFPNDPACCVIKHNNPCGVAIGSTLEEAYMKAYHADPVSAFGGVFGLNRPVTAEIAEELSQLFVEIVIAPDFQPEARDILAKKKNVRLLQAPAISQPPGDGSAWVLKDLQEFGLILQENPVPRDMPELTTVTQQTVSETVLSDVGFAWAVVKHLTSNAIVLAKNGQTVGLGIGQTSRIGSMEIALAQAGEKAKGAVLASDGFFPATDNIEAAAQAGVSVIIQPGGSIKDPEVIEAADQHGLAMMLTHERCFKH